MDGPNDGPGGPGGPGGPDGKRRNRNFGPGNPGESPESEAIRKKLLSLPPEKRGEFMKNLKNWEGLTPEQKDSMRSRAREHRERMRRDLDDAIASFGPDLAPERKEEFMRVYAERRKALEERIRKEMEESRQKGLRQILEDLKKEFAVPADPKSSPTPAGEKSAEEVKTSAVSQP